MIPILVFVAIVISASVFFLVSRSNEPTADVGTDPAAADYIDDYTLDESNGSGIEVPIDQAGDKIAITEKNESGTTKSSPNEKNAVTPVIVYAGVFGDNLEISAYAPVTETDGLCSATVTSVSSGKILTVQDKSTPSASTTDCVLLVIPISQLDSGTNKVVVSYSSSLSEGSSNVVEVYVP